jgi:ABC-type polysaccharide/polyol phosphate export permease
MRFIFPLWYLGGFQFSWKIFYKVSPSFAYLNLANPMTYVMEAMRGAILGQEDYIAFWYCMLALLFFSTICWFFALKKLKNRLDFV